MTEAEWLASEDPAAMLNALRKQDDRAGRGHDISDRKLRLFACACLRAEPHFPRLRNAMIAQSLRLAEGHADGTIDAARLATGVFRHNDSATWLYQAQAAACCWSCAAEGAVEVVSLATGSHEEEEAEESSRRCADLLRDIVGSPFRPMTLPPNPDCSACGGSGTFVVGNGEDAERIRCRCCPWLTPTVVSLAQAAYGERGRQWVGRKHDHDEASGWEKSGHLDPFRLSLVTDALEEAGCPQDVDCPGCKGRGVVTHEDDHGFFHTGCEKCGGDGEMTWRDGGGWGPPVDEGGRKGAGRLPHPILAHLRGQGPHVRGCQVIDLLTGRE